jgi:hypothetical protein
VVGGEVKTGGSAPPDDEVNSPLQEALAVALLYDRRRSGS